jgi:NADP-dependent 3-hydroxy acid dehydrogenase YdfG
VAGYDPKWFEGVVERIGPVLKPVDVARVIVTVAAQPPHVHMSEVLLRPTRQDYP